LAAWIVSITLTVRRVLIAAATLALMATAPGVTGSASASDDIDSYDASWTCLNGATALSTAQRTGVDAAGASYDRVVTSAQGALKVSLSALRTSVLADPTVLATRARVTTAHAQSSAAHGTGAERAAELAYKNAKHAYNDALNAAKTRYMAAAQSTLTLYRSAVANAEGDYVKVLTPLFAPDAIPSELRSPNDHHDGGGDDCEDQEDD
jgi:hypothetical protein